MRKSKLTPTLGNVGTAAAAGTEAVDEREAIFWKFCGGPQKGAKTQNNFLQFFAESLMLARGGSVTERQIRNAWFNWSGGKTTKEK